MTDRVRWSLLVLGCALALAAVLQVPQLRHVADPRYQGLLIELNSDEAVYRARVGEALAGRPEQASEAFVGDANIRGTQVALLEAAIGTFFAPTGWRAPTVLQIGDSLVPFLLFIVLWIFLRLCGFTRWQALIASIAFSFIELYNLGRPIHLRLSSLVTLVALCGLLLGLRGRLLLGILGAFLLGTLVGMYVWSWTFAWAWWGVLTLWLWCEWFFTPARRGFASRIGQALATVLGPLRRFLRREEPFLPVPWQRLLFFGCIGVLAAWPHVAHLIDLSGHPLYPEAVFRSGMHPGRLPESWAYSALFTAMFGSVLLSIRRYSRELLSYRAAVTTIAAAWIVIHQQIVHGIVFNFVSHSIFFLAVAALCSVLLWWNLRGPVLAVGAAAACVYLAAIAWDGRYVVNQFRVDASSFGDQHLASALPVLDAIPRTRILSDDQTQHTVAGFTHHDVVFSVYLKNVLVSHEELAERLCLTLIPVPPDMRNISERGVLIYPDAVSAFRDDPSVRTEEIRLVEEACARMDGDPAMFLQRYDVEYILWDEVRQPAWELERFGVELALEASGEGWSLWRVIQAP